MSPPEPVTDSPAHVGVEAGKVEDEGVTSDDGGSDEKDMKSLDKQEDVEKSGQQDGEEEVTSAASTAGVQGGGSAQQEKKHEVEEQDTELDGKKKAYAADSGLSQELHKKLQLDESTSSKTEVSSPLPSPLPTTTNADTTSNPPPLPPKDEKYMSKGKGLGLGLDTGLEDESKLQEKSSNDATAEESESEIASIMEQFDDGKEGPGEQEIMSPRLEIAQPMFGFEGGAHQHPPRKSSLEPLNRSGTPESLRKSSSALISPPPRTSSLALGGSPATSIKGQTSIPPEPESPLTPQVSTKSLPPPPQPDPEPDLPFDFQRFLEQLRHKSADPVAKYLRSFLLEFGKKPWMVHEQVKIISDFLEFITKKMAGCDVWRTVSDAEFDNAREGMEKLVMNRLYTQTFSPAIPAPEQPVGGSRGKRRAEGRAGRRGQHQEDVERDEVLAQKVRIYGWVREEHLDIPPIGEKGRKFMDLAQKEILKMKSYRAPRDKVICILNCCKVIFGFLRNAPSSDQSADSFIPLMIYVVLRANPDHLVSNVQYILRFRNQDKLGGEAGYYISSLMGAIQFIENLDRTSLTISDEDFEREVERAVSRIAEKHALEEEKPPALPPGKPPPSPGLMPAEKSALARAEVTPRNSMDVAEQSTPRRSTSSRRARNAEDEKAAATGSGEEENAALAVLRTIQRPLSTIGRIFSDDNTTTSTSTSTGPAATPARSPAPEGGKPQLSAEELASRQANAEARQAREISAREEKNLVETLGGMFPQLEKEVLVDVVRANEGRVGKAVDACLALSAS